MNAGLHDLPGHRRAECVIDEARARRNTWQREHRQPAPLTAREALAAAQYELLLIWTAAANLRAGVELTDADFNRLTTAVRRVELLCHEAGQ